jgi:hypothetical protein
MMQDPKAHTLARQIHAGVVCFNNGEFYAAHDQWEALWQQAEGADKAFLQGMVQIAVACHHAQAGNLKGAAQLWEGAQGRLRPFTPRFAGIDTGELLAELRHTFAPLDGIARVDLPGAVRDQQKPAPVRWQFVAPRLTVS